MDPDLLESYQHEVKGLRWTRGVEGAAKWLETEGFTNVTFEKHTETTATITAHKDDVIYTFDCSR